MLDYVKEDRFCRSRMIAGYFGDPDLKSCGICDNCLRNKKMVLDRSEFDSLQAEITSLVRQHPIHIKELAGKMTGMKKEKTWKLLELMQDENIIKMNEMGILSLVNNEFK